MSATKAMKQANKGRKIQTPPKAPKTADKPVSAKVEAKNVKRRQAEAKAVAGLTPPVVTPAAPQAPVTAAAPQAPVTAAVVNGKLSSHARGIAYSATRPGTISAMIECLLAAEETGGISKEAITAYALARCGKCNAATTQMQVPSGLLIEKGIVCTKGPSGYYVTAAEFELYANAVRSGGLTMKEYAKQRHREIKSQREAALLAAQTKAAEAAKLAAEAK